MNFKSADYSVPAQRKWLSSLKNFYSLFFVQYLCFFAHLFRFPLLLCLKAVFSLFFWLFDELRLDVCELQKNWFGYLSPSNQYSMRRSFQRDNFYFVRICTYCLLKWFSSYDHTSYVHLGEFDHISCFNLMTWLTVARLTPTTAEISLYVLAVRSCKVTIFVRFLGVASISHGGWLTITCKAD